MTNVKRPINVLLFAGARAAAGAEQLTVTLEPDATGRDLRAALAATYPQLAALVAASRFAVDMAFIDDDQPLGETREVAWIPPVSGG